MQASVLVATYNQPQFLARTLAGLRRQTRADFETIICDDGSGPEVAEVVARCVGQLSGPVRHVRQEDAGFRKCRILNMGIAHSAADYLIFLDADCIPHRRFVDAHLRGRAAGSFLVGRRVQLSAQVTARLSEEAVRAGRLEWIWLSGLVDALAGRIRHLEAAFRIPYRAWKRIGPSDLPLKGCNFSCWKSDMAAVNGFDEEFTTAGVGEDTDLERRLRLLGLKGISVKHAAICYHQWHPLVPRDPAGMARFEGLRRAGAARCLRGLAQIRTAERGAERAVERRKD
ncbi:MAG: glycosyltransferase [Kiritimatiellae bacterium]|nr:glycosyltransferase [Kiritimatiellia bacterium]